MREETTLESTVNQPVDFNYKDIDLNAESFRDLDEQKRKILIQRFIDLVLYNDDRFKIAVKLLQKWETETKD